MTRRKVILTGASSGIGAAIRRRLLKDGHQVIGVCRQPEVGEASDDYFATTCDLSELDNLHETFQSILTHHGDIDALILNAGAPLFGYLEQLSHTQIRDAISLNLTSHLLVAHEVVPWFKQRGRGNVIVMGSESALRGGRQGSIYCAAKFGLRGFALSLREECAASGVGVTLIHPGMTRTPMFDTLDFAPGSSPDNAIDPDDIAAAVMMILKARPGTVFDEVELSPMKKVIDFGKPPGRRQNP